MDKYSKVIRALHDAVKEAPLASFLGLVILFVLLTLVPSIDLGAAVKIFVAGLGCAIFALYLWDGFINWMFTKVWHPLTGGSDGGGNPSAEDVGENGGSVQGQRDPPPG